MFRGLNQAFRGKARGLSSGRGAPSAALAAVAEPGGGDTLRRRRVEARVLVTRARDGETRALLLAGGRRLSVRDSFGGDEPVARRCEAGGRPAFGGAARRVPARGLSVLDRAVARCARLVLCPAPDARLEAAVVRQQLVEAGQVDAAAHHRRGCLRGEPVVGARGADGRGSARYERGVLEVADNAAVVGGAVEVGATVRKVLEAARARLAVHGAGPVEDHLAPGAPAAAAARDDDDL